MTKHKIECPFCSRSIAADAREKLLWHCDRPRGGVPCNGSGDNVSDLIAKHNEEDSNVIEGLHAMDCAGWL